MKIRSLVRNVMSCLPDATLRAVAQQMTAEDVGSLAVVKGAELTGIVSERDIVRAVAEGADLGTSLVEKFMTQQPETVHPDTDLTDAAQWMLVTGHRHLPVVDGTELLGMFSIKDVLWALAEQPSEQLIGVPFS